MKDACIIGAGSAGLPAAKALLDRGLDFDWFEMGSAIGGNWRFGNDNGRSSAYASLHIDTSKERMAYADLPMPQDWPTYLHHTQVLEYFERYAAAFDLLPHCTFRTEVIGVRPVPGDDRVSPPVWEVTVRSVDGGPERVERYRSVLVANGHHWCPNAPGWLDDFTGERFHSHHYRTPDVLEGRRVLVVGIGNSGTDIACEAVNHAVHVSLSTRRGAHVIPRYILGRPTDQWADPDISRLPLGLQRLAYRVLLWLSRGRQRRYGVPVPPNRILEEHPTMSQDLLPLVQTGRITMRPDVASVRGDLVEFVDGTTAVFDTVVAATGYTISFPFLPDEVMRVEDNEVDLYKQVVHPDQPGLYFLGLIQPLGAIMPLAEAQAKWVARLIEGAPLPARTEMRAAIERRREARRARYVPSRRHTIQVDYWPYLLDIRSELEQADRALASVE